jgi:voltage-gated potassium channel Kch
VIGRFLIANGIKATILDDNPDNIQILRKYGFKVYYGDATRSDLLRSAGAAQARVIVVAVEDKQQSLKIIDTVQRNHPHLKILARAMDMDHTYALMNRKVDGFDRDVFESALQLGTKVLGRLGFQKYQAFRLARTFRKHNQDVIWELCRHHGEDEKRYLYEDRKRALELEEMLQAEQEDSTYIRDFSWDASSRREEARGD